MKSVRKYLNILVFGVIVLVIVGLAVNHSRHLRTLVDGLRSTDPQVQRTSADQLLQEEAFSDSISGELIPTRVAAAGALEALGSDKAVDKLLGLLKDLDKPVRERAVVALKHVGASGDKNLAKLLGGLADSDPNVRKSVIDVLTNPKDGVGPKPAVVTAIVSQIKSSSDGRAAAGDVLGSDTFRPARASATQQLLALLDTKSGADDGARAGAADALGKLEQPDAIPALVAGMAEGKAQLRSTCVSAIALIADKSSEAPLTEAINNPNDDAEARAQAAAGLGKIGTPTAVATLIKALDDDDLKLRSAAVAALARAGRPKLSGPVNGPVLAVLIASLHDPRADVRLGTTQAMQAIAAPQTDSALVSLLNADQANSADAMRSAAASALGFEGNTAAVEPLIRALKDPSGDVALAAADSLALIGPAATRALIATLHEGGPSALYASGALGRLGSTAVPALEKAATSSDAVTARWSAVALGNTGAPEAGAALKRLASAPNRDLAYVAGLQLLRLGYVEQ